VIAHHHRVLHEEEIGAAAELFDLSQRTGRSGGGSDGDELGEFELVFFASVLVVLGVLADEFAVFVMEAEELI